MAVNLFPAAMGVSAAARPLPLYRDVQWLDGRPVYRNGVPVIVTGLPALRGWIWRALMTVRYDHRIHTNLYGCELTTLAGKPYSAAVKSSEAQRMVADALLCNPYITGIPRCEVRFDETTVHINCAVTTIYGEVAIDV